MRKILNQRQNMKKKYEKTPETKIEDEKNKCDKNPVTKNNNNKKNIAKRCIKEKQNMFK